MFNGFRMMTGRPEEAPSDSDFAREGNVFHEQAK